MLCFVFSLLSCSKVFEKIKKNGAVPVLISSSVDGDADKCVLWIHPKDKSLSVLIGNDKSSDGALHVWDMEGREIYKTPLLDQPVGVDVRTGFSLGGNIVDIVVCGLRSTDELKVFLIDPQTRHLKDVTTLGGIRTGFSSATYGIALYKRLKDNDFFVFVSRKLSFDVHQIRLEDDLFGKIKGIFIRSFGEEDQEGFVKEMIADDELEVLYCSDGKSSILKYHTNPEMPKHLISRFAIGDEIGEERAGLGLYKEAQGKGYLVVSSQGTSSFNIYDRTGDNAFVKSVEPQKDFKTNGIAVISTAIPPKFPCGLIVCHNDNEKNFVFYEWEAFFSEKTILTQSDEAERPLLVYDL